MTYTHYQTQLTALAKYDEDVCNDLCNQWANDPDITDVQAFDLATVVDDLWEKTLQKGGEK